MPRLNMIPAPEGHRGTRPNPWRAAVQRWLTARRETAEMAAMSERERRDARVSDYDIRWRR
jgi:uncharacterized protein YjiS (DUF1127 family)